MSILSEINRITNIVSNIKKAIAQKGVTVPDTSVIEDIPRLIGLIPTGVDTSDATATADQILNGETAYVNSEKVTGTYIPIVAKFLTTIVGMQGSWFTSTGLPIFKTYECIVIWDGGTTLYQGLVMAVYDGSTGNTSYICCTNSSTKACEFAKSNEIMSISDDGKIKWLGTGNAAMRDKEDYYYIAFGKK